MAILEVLTVPDPRLKQKAKPVDVVDDNIRKILDDMLETMYAVDCCGLAATQVGIDQRLLVMDTGEGPNNEPQPYKMVNPEIIWNSDNKKDLDEACASFPNQFAKVTRPAHVKVKYLDENGIERVLVTEGVLSACVQHEIDHLDGILFLEHISPLKRNILMRRYKKGQRLYASG